MIKWRLRIACWIPKATDTHSEYIILFAFARQEYLGEHTQCCGFTYIACLVNVSDRDIDRTGSYVASIPVDYA
jgi:hypothetical protein